MIDRAIKSRCRATDRGTLGADRRPSAVGLAGAGGGWCSRVPRHGVPFGHNCW